MQIENTIEVGREEARELILDNKGKFFGVIFVRKQPKCLDCNKRYKNADVAPTECTKCGGEVSFIRTASGLLGVKNPKSGATVPGQGQYEGESFETALSKGRVKYYDANVQQSNGRGDYRQFLIDNIVELQISRTRYKVVDVD